MPRVLVRQQRHRGDRAGVMTVLTGFLQDGRDVLAEGDRLCRRLLTDHDGLRRGQNNSGDRESACLTDHLFPLQL